MRAYNPAYIEASPHGVFYLRWPLPARLHPSKKASTIKLSLRTRQRREALRLARRLGEIADQAIRHGIHSGMRYSEIRELVRSHFEAALRKRRELFEEQGPLSGEDRYAWQTTQQIMAEAVTQDQLSLYDELTDGPTDIERFATHYGIDLSASTSLRSSIQREYYKGQRDYANEILSLDKEYGRYDFGNALVDNISFSKNDVLKDIGGSSLSSFIESYSAEKKMGRAWSAKTEIEKQDHFKLLFEIVGESLLLPSFNHETALAVKNVLSRFPKNRNKNPLTRGKSLSDALDVEGVSCIEATTINKYLQTYNDLFGWGVRSRLVADNPFRGQTIRQNRNRSPNKRTAFDDENIRKIISVCTDQSSSLVKTPYRKWGTLIAAYTGMRLNEICQLHVGDIKQVGDVWCADINDSDDRSVKSSAAVRLVPLHSQLIELGFLKYVAERRTAGKLKLFDGLSYCPKNGWGRSLGRWFAERLMPSIGLTQKELVFHSFRHTVIEKLYHASIEEPVIKALVGHAKEGVTQQNYFGSGYKPHQLKAAIERIEYY